METSTRSNTYCQIIHAIDKTVDKEENVSMTGALEKTKSDRQLETLNAGLDKRGFTPRYDVEDVCGITLKFVTSDGRICEVLYPNLASNKRMVEEFVVVANLWCEYRLIEGLHVAIYRRSTSKTLHLGWIVKEYYSMRQDEF